MLTCGNCGRVLTHEDCFCDGVVCINCGELAHRGYCAGRCYDGCRASVLKKYLQLEWLVRQNNDVAACPWLPCGSADCAQWGTNPAICERVSLNMLLESSNEPRDS